MEIYFSRHAKRQMRWRKITIEEVNMAIYKPDNIVAQEDGRSQL